ncbi:HAD family hydrolase [Aspergillus puulaauensis]|uniref:HAD-like domain-containing protein n=1 Tax=Aspergillus puulaauensis TaxID=1220207 RepID=A0A7R7XYH2_9EURO|nr:uncharacterized protein APUU_80370A [Aspergillus puulaauensis]BCS30067.1 hypothetical protein APUU_80370A [Aspergillus puulaauensis]
MTAEENTASVRTLLQAKEWVGFDLDDTLHEFRRASTAASLSAFNQIHNDYSVPISALESSYNTILASKTAGAFSDGKSSTEYRRERFAALLQSQGIQVVGLEEYMDSILVLYKRSLATSLTLKPGALDLLTKLKELGKKVIVITEGPRDAQEWTIGQLGLKAFVDVLVTSNELGFSKTDRLFREVLRRQRIQADQMVYIGDNEARDVLPAREEGIVAVHFDEKSPISIDFVGSLPKVNSLAGLYSVLRS